MTPLRFISLFAGIGGFDLGLERAGMVCVAQVEIDDYARSVLERHWPHVPRFRDVRSVSAWNLPPCDVLCGGFPCQDISDAGSRGGIGGARSSLWSEYARLIRELRPRYVLVENVAALLDWGIDVVLGDLAQIGYDAEWSVLSACAVGAPHTRERLFIVAYPNSQHGAPRLGIVQNGTQSLSQIDRRARAEQWIHAVSGANRSAYGIPRRMERIQGLGNSIVPQIPELIGRAIIALEANL